jgi:hypothetical protein
MELKKVGKILLPVASIALTIASSIISNKQQEETIAKKVAEALADQTKES